MQYLELDEDHLHELEAIVEDYGIGVGDYAPMERFEVLESFGGRFSEEELLRLKEIVEAAIQENGDYSSSLMSELLTRIDRALEFPVIDAVEIVDDDDEEIMWEDEGDEDEYVAGDDEEEEEEEEEEEPPPPVRGVPPERWPPVAWENPSRTTVSIWLDKDRFRTIKQAKNWLKKQGQRFKLRHYQTDNFWAFPQMSESKERRYRGKIRSKYISEGVLLKFVPARFL
jgi:hypothetical protein